MLDIIFIVLFIFNIILMIYAITERNIAFTLLTGIIWLILALFVIQGIELPYEMMNSTSGNIETGTHLIQTNLDPLAYLFAAIGVIMFILFFTFTLEGFQDYRKIK